MIHGPTAIQANSVVERRANVDRSVVWQNTSIDEHAEIRGSLLGVECTVQANAVIFEGAVIGDQTVIRRGAIIQPNVKIWPHKEVEAGAVVSSSIIWGSAGRRTLFGRFGVSGLINVDFTPEVMAKLGSAYASTLPLGCDVTVNRDLAIPSRMLERALASGLPSAGVNVVDLSAVPIPVARYYTAGSGAVGGVHVRTSSDDPSVIHINFFDRDGMDLDKGIQRKVESAYFREDVRRAQLEDIGTTSYASGVVWRYTEAFMEVIDRSSMEHSPYRLVVDYDRGPTSDVLLPILRSLGCDVVDLNAGSGFTRAARSQPEYVTAFEQLATIVPALHFDLGAMLNVTGEKLHIVDGTGRKLPEMQMLVALACLVFQQYEGATVAVPVDAPTIFESLATRYGGKVLRTRLDPQSIMAAARQKHVRLAGDGRGCTIFPEFHGAYDGMYTLVKLLELLRRRRTTIQDVVGGLPSWHIKETDVPCPWDKKGQVMRVLGEQYRERGDLAGIPAGYPAPGLGDPLGAPRRGDTRRVPDSPSPTRGSSPDGIKIQLGDDWVLILPDPDEPQVHLVTQAHSEREAQTLVDKYVGIVTGLQV